MLRLKKEESDDDEYVPAGLMNSAQTLGRKDNEICEFYNTEKPAINEANQEKSEKPADSFVTLTSKPSPSIVQQLAQPNMQVPRVCRPTIASQTPFPMQPIIYQQRPIQHPPPGLVPVKIFTQPPMYPHYMRTVPVPMGRGLPPRMLMIPPGLPPNRPIPHFSVIPPASIAKVKSKMSPEVRRKIRKEAAAKMKAERDAKRALLKAKRSAEKKALILKKKKEIGEKSAPTNKKFVNFSKDMFVIRLKDVDSFERNNEIWRIDNHILIQKFCGVPSLRAPARQFQSTNRMSGYDSRAAWRLFIINPENVEVDKYGSEITVHDFPSISVLREAKQQAEEKDVEFREIEELELKEKLNQFEAKKYSRKMERQRQRMARKQRKFEEKKLAIAGRGARKVRRIDDWLEEEKDEDVCRNIMNGLLNALEDEQFEEEEEEEEESLVTSESCSEDEDDDAGSLISLVHSSDSDQDIAFELYGENEVPAVALELII